MKKSKLLMPLAGIAAVGAIAPIVTLASCNKGTALVNETDKAFMNKANNYLAQKTGTISAHKAVQVLKDLDVDVLNYNLSNSTSQFAFDTLAKRFIIMNGDNVVAAPEKYEMSNSQAVFVFTTTYTKGLKYGQYLKENFELPTNSSELEVDTSLDVGYNSNIETVKYVGDATNTKNVLLRTNCEVVKIDAQKDTVFHMGVANNLTVTGATTKPEFYEVGWVGYLTINSAKLNLAKIDNVDVGKVDILNAGTGSEMGATNDGTVSFHVKAFDTGTTPGTLVTPTKISGKDAFGTVASGFYQLTGDVTLSKAVNFADVTVVIDLNGHKITEDTTSTITDTKLINVTTSALEKTSNVYIIDTSTSREGSIDFTENYIAVEGFVEADATTGVVKGSPASLYIEGGNYKFTGLGADGAKSRRDGMFQVGNTKNLSAGIAFSRMFMYGGKINTALKTGVTSEHKNQANGIYLACNSYLQVAYGSITSTETCIRGSGTYSGNDSYIDIFGGTLTQTSPTFGECILQSQGGSLNISGGTFTGLGCIAVKNGNVNISGGYFHATGECHKLSTATRDTRDIDGSVLSIELTPTQYGINPSVTVHNATLYSEKSYICQIYGQDRAAGQHLGELEFVNGVYYYGMNEYPEGEISSYSGIRIEQAVEDDIIVSQNGGSWVYNPAE